MQKNADDSTDGTTATLASVGLDPNAQRRIEDAVLTGIARGERRRRVRRNRLLAGGTGLVAVLAIAAGVGGAIVGAGPSGGSSDSAASEAAPRQAAEPGAAADAPEASPAEDPAMQVTGSASVQVASVPEAQDAVAASVDALGGRVVQRSTASEGTTSDVVAEPAVGSQATMPWYPGANSMTVTVPAASATDFMSGLRNVGEVVRSSTGSIDVGGPLTDYRIRIESLEGTIDRLHTLQAQAENVHDLLAIEQQLEMKTSELEQVRAQQTGLDASVSSATITITFVTATETQTARPEGFVDGLVAGWNALVASIDWLVVGLGAIVPWLGVAAFIGALVWGVWGVRRVRRRGARRDTGR